MSKLAQRLQMKPGTRWALVNAPTHYAGILDAPVDATISTAITNDINGIQLMASSFLRKTAMTLKNCYRNLLRY